MSKRADPVLYNQFAGLRNTVPEERMQPSDLTVAQNLDLDDTNGVRRRRGFALVKAGEFHSLYKNALNSRCLVSENGVLSRLYPDYSTVSLGVNVGNRPVSYTDVGEQTFFSTSQESGVVEADDTVSPWGLLAAPRTWESPVITPTANLPEVAGKVVSAPPTAESIAYLNGRIYLAAGQLIWATELYRYHIVDRTRGYLYYEKPVTQIIAVTDGLYVGTTDAVYFLSGTFGEMQRRRILNSGMLPRSAVHVDPKHVTEQGSESKQGVLFLTSTGLYAGFDSGVCLDLVKNRFKFPMGESAAAMYREQDGIHQYVGVISSSGQSTSKARFGDFVDAEIRRFSEN